MPTGKRQLAWLILAVALVAGAVAAGLTLATSGPPRGALSGLSGREDAIARVGAVGLSARPDCWVASWAASPQPATPGSTAAEGLDDQSVREVVFASLGGATMRVRFDNTYGSRPLEIGAAAVGVPRAGGSVIPGSQRRLTFSGQTSTEVPPGAQIVSDPVDLHVAALGRVTVTVFAPAATGPASQHFDAEQQNYIARGNHVMDATAGAFTMPNPSWLFLSGVEVLTPRCRAAAIVALGDSLTDGIGSTPGANARWPNDLARRLAAGGADLAVLDEGIGGNRLLTDAPRGGVDAVARLDRDVLSQPGATGVIVFDGINDIGIGEHLARFGAPPTRVLAARLIEGYEQIIAQAHAAGLKVFGATLLPFRGAGYWTAAGERVREAVNDWIRAGGAYDGAVDFARAVADPRDPQRLAAAYDSGDHLHPDDAGYRAMADAVSLHMLLGSIPSSRSR